MEASKTNDDANAANRTEQSQELPLSPVLLRYSCNEEAYADAAPPKHEESADQK